MMPKSFPLLLKLSLGGRPVMRVAVAPDGITGPVKGPAGQVYAVVEAPPPAPDIPPVPAAPPWAPLPPPVPCPPAPGPPPVPVPGVPPAPVAPPSAPPPDCPPDPSLWFALTQATAANARHTTTK